MLQIELEPWAGAGLEEKQLIDAVLSAYPGGGARRERGT